MGHFSYIGDADGGEGTNIGAGTITCNYDGQEKHRTVIGRGVFIGSDPMLVAPVTPGDGAPPGAGSGPADGAPGRAAAGAGGAGRGAPTAGRAQSRTVEPPARTRDERLPARLRP